MRVVLCWLAAAITLDAGVVKGLVLEKASGSPLARTQVRLQPVPNAFGNTARSLQVRTERAGQFVFPSVPDGLYLLIATREYFFPTAYGQRRPSGQGKAIQVTSDSQLFAELSMPRMGSITGRVLDENNVGIPKVNVLAYPARLPLRAAGRAESDDRGVYRIPGLQPGKYWVRTATHTLDDGSGLLPTFGPESLEVRDARVQQVNVDDETAYADVRPQFGKLFHLGGRIACDAMDSVIVKLSSDTGTRTTNAACPGQYAFEGLAPGIYEVFAATQRGTSVGFVELSVDHDTDSGSVQLMAPPRVDIEMQRANSTNREQIPLVLTGRRQDFSEADTEHDIEMPQATLTPGRWELKARPGPGLYVESIENLRAGPRRPWKVDPVPGWFDVFIEMRRPALLLITVSDQVGRMAGRVTTGSQPIPGIPVFLWPVTETARRSLGGTPQGLSDTEGRFEFHDLPPGDYRLLATSDLSEVDEETLNTAGAVSVRIEPSQTATANLSVWLAP